MSKRTKVEEENEAVLEEIRQEAAAQQQTEVPAKTKEGRDAKWRRLANRRVPNAVKALLYVERLADRRQYSYTDEQREKVIKILKTALDNLEQAYKGRKVEVNGTIF